MSTLNESLHQIMREGVMSNIHQIAQESNSAQDFIKKFNAEYGDQLWADTPDDIHAKDINQWLIDLYNDAKSMEESVNEGTYTTTYMGANVLPPNYGNSKLNTVAEEVYGKKFLELTDELQKKIIDLFRDQAVKRNVYESVNEGFFDLIRKAFRGKLTNDEENDVWKITRIWDDADSELTSLDDRNADKVIWGMRDLTANNILQKIDPKSETAKTLKKLYLLAKKQDPSSAHFPDMDKISLPESVNEGMDKNAIRQQIAIIDKQIDTETGGFGEPLTDETLQALEIERERLQKLSSESLNEIGVLAVAGGIILGILGWKIIKAIFKKVVGGIGMNVTLDKEKLKETVNRIHRESIKKGISGSQTLQVLEWKKKVIEQIDAGEITKLKDIMSTLNAEFDESINEAVPSQEDYHTKDKKDVLFTIPGPHAKALATSRAIYKDITWDGNFDEFFANDKGNESGEFLISFPSSVNDVTPAGIDKIIKLVGNRGTHVERPDWANESVSDFHEVVSNTMARQTAKTMIAEVANVFGVASIPKKYSKSTTIMIGYVRKCIKENKKLKRNDLIDFNQSAKMILENTSINEIMVTI